MVRYRRNKIPGGRYAFTVAIADRTAATLVTHIDTLRAAFATTRAERPFTIDAIVILPDHLHTIWSLPDDDADFSGRWRRIKALFTRHATASQSRWQPRFWEHTIRDDDDFARHVAYIHYNPVKHGLVPTVREWPHSSFHRYVTAGLLPQDWGGTHPTQPTTFRE